MYRVGSLFSKSPRHSQKSSSSIYECTTSNIPNAATAVSAPVGSIDNAVSVPEQQCPTETHRSDTNYIMPLGDMVDSTIYSIPAPLKSNADCTSSHTSYASPPLDIIDVILTSNTYEDIPPDDITDSSVYSVPNSLPAICNNYVNHMIETNVPHVTIEPCTSGSVQEEVGVEVKRRNGGLCVPLGDQRVTSGEYIYMDGCCPPSEVEVRDGEDVASKSADTVRRHTYPMHVCIACKCWSHMHVHVHVHVHAC